MLALGIKASLHESFPVDQRVRNTVSNLLWFCSKEYIVWSGCKRSEGIFKSLFNVCLWSDFKVHKFSISEFILIKKCIQKLLFKTFELKFAFFF